MTDTKNILLIGSTGNGKSTLANVITKSNDFKESNYSVSETKEIKAKEITEKEKTYRIIDTVGISDTRMSLEKDLYNLVKLSEVVKDGLSQIFLVTSGKLSEETKFTYSLLKKVIFGESIIKYTTIVRTNFVNFSDKDERDEDEKELIESSGEEFGEIIRNCVVIHVDNPSVDIKDEQRKGLSITVREESRKKILDHLIECKGVCDSITKSIELSDLKKWISSKEEIIRKAILYIKNNKKLSKGERKELEEIEKNAKAELFSQIGTKIKEFERLNQKLSQKESEYNKISIEKDNLKIELEDNKKKLENSKEREQSLNNQVNSLNISLNIEQERLQKLINDNCAYQKDLENLREQLDAKTKELNDKKIELDKFKEPTEGDLTEEEKEEVKALPFSAVAWRVNRGGYLIRSDGEKKVFDKIKSWRREKIQYLLKIWPHIIGEKKWLYYKNWIWGWWDNHYSFYEKIRELAEKQLEEIGKGETEQIKHIDQIEQPPYSASGS